MTGRSLRQNIGLVLFGLFVCLVLMEAGLRISGALYRASRDRRNREALRDAGAYRILCLGESTTAGFGDAYPAHLERILNTRLPGKTFKVINEGIGGAKTGLILSNLPGNMEKYKPHMIITMMGVNDAIDEKMVSYGKPGRMLPDRRGSGTASVQFLRVETRQSRGHDAGHFRQCAPA